MAGFVYCRWPGCAHSGSARTMAEHEATCPHSPDYVALPEPTPLPCDHVRPDHFLRSFDRAAEGEPRLRAMAGHAAYLYNCLQDEKRARVEMMGQIVAQLREGVNPVAIALDLQAELHDLEE